MKGRAVGHRSIVRMDPFLYDLDVPRNFFAVKKEERPYSNQEDSLITDSQNPMEQSYTRLERL